MNMQAFINKMLVVDYITINRDRHGANIEILKYKDKEVFAPLFDNGLTFACSITIEQQTKVNLTKFRKAAFDMVDKIKYGEALKAEGKAEGFAEGKLSAIIIAMTKSKSKGKEYCIRLSKELLGATDEEINKAIKEVFGS